MSSLFHQTLAQIGVSLRRWGPPDADEVWCAVHESAHAIVAMDAGFRVTRITIHRSTGGAVPWEGTCETVFNQPVDPAYRAGLRMLEASSVAAPIAVRDDPYRYFEGYVAAAGAEYRVNTDDVRLRELADELELAGPVQLWGFRQEAVRMANTALRTYEHAHERLAFELLARRKLSEADVRVLAGELATRWETIAAPAVAS